MILQPAHLPEGCPVWKHLADILLRERARCALERAGCALERASALGARSGALAARQMRARHLADTWSPKWVKYVVLEQHF